MMEKEKIIKRLDLIITDMENDAKNIDGMPFNGKTMGTYFGYQMAAIKALASTMKEILENPESLPTQEKEDK